MDADSATDRGNYTIFFVDRGGADIRPSEWPVCDLCPERIRVVRDGVAIGEVSVTSRGRTLRGGRSRPVPGPVCLDR